ncbi:HAD family hydrolase [Campylobacter sp. US33a]|uniref:phosphoglycolate phosphatase n=1 Tax=Campylobacter sp. CCS1377 TaxID=3158229 RepID=A0AAU7E952_9BACT|nr:HAD family hydrolase [Campylobacter sp. US33a]MCW1360389.1 HAD family hydrolase [Campylobacter jejuni]TEY02680.1 HAD family hydrolase [Campylobacter sp. US33a]
MINIIFDMDGTLIDSANAITQAVNEIRNELGLEALERSYIMNIVNTPNLDWAKILYGFNEFNHQSFKEGYEKYFLKHYKQSVVLFEGVKDVLEFCKNKNCYLAIATNAPQSSLNPILEKHEIMPYFHKILGVNFDIEPKPSPMMANLIKEQAWYEKSIFIGDSKKDEECALNAKMPYLQAKWYEEKSKENEFSNAKELIELIKNLM